MIISGGVVVKEAVKWTGSPATWGSWPSSLQLGAQWVSYAGLYRRQTWVRTVVDKRADLLARLPLKVYEHDDLNRPEVPQHPYARLLAHPNPKHSRFELWRWVEATYDIYGEAFLGKVRDAGGRPVMLVPLHPTSMHVEEERDERVIWTFDNGKVKIVGIPDEDLVHPRAYNPDSYARGLSKLESLRATLENEDAALRAQSSFWKRGARPGVALKHPGVLSPPVAERVRLQWDQIASGADNFGRTVVLEEGMEPAVMQLSAEEAQYIDARKLNREEVVAAYDMPPPAVHILDNATYSNITAQLRSVYRDTMAPICVMHESVLETQLRGAVRPGMSDPDFGDEVYAEFLMDGVLRGDFEERADAYQKAINSGSMTPAEVRKLENLPFIEGSDRLFINSTMVPIQVAATPEPAPPAELEPGQVRMVMGRLSRPKTLEDIDRRSLVAGLNGHSGLVLAELDAAVAGGEGVMQLRERIKGLAAAAYRDEYLELVKAIALKEPALPPAPMLTVNVPEQKTPVVNVAPAEVRVDAPQVTVEAPVVNVPAPTVQIREQRGPRRKELRHDELGQLVEVIEHDE